MGKKPVDIKSIFFEALRKKNATERAAYLDIACGKDASLRAEVESLLKSHEKAGDFLPSPDLDIDVTLDSSPLTEGPGTVIGNYKLLEQIGEGGMAVVYMAEQEKPLRRRVALKIIKLGMDTKSVIARFEVERQALAMMDHPNISKVFDAGATETGRPYFVMELVKGISITDYCDKNKLSTKERLDLFTQVCNAVQHAHQKGIIHRDIKPSNVMVTLHDGKPVPKVIDFGIAKATSQRLTEKTVFTRYAQMIGTPAYMSPEQAEMSGLDVDTRTDIYSLGVLLYELLTGVTPFSEEQLCEAGYLEMQRIIREEEPLKPSTKLSTLGDTLTDVAEHRRASPDLLKKLVRGDIDWIVMRSLEKDRTRRYETVNSLSMDIQRHLSDEPVHARPPSTIYRLHKLLRRHRFKVVAAAALAVLLACMIVVLLKWNRNRLQLIKAESFSHRGILSGARESYSNREFVSALSDVKSILTSKHVGPEARLLYASILIDGQYLEKAVVTLEYLLDERPEIAGAAHALLARVYWESELGKAERIKKVNEHRRKAQELLPETAEAYFLRGLTRISVKEKLQLLDKALQFDPGHYESRKLRAFIYYASKKYQQMKDDALAMVVLRPKDSQGHLLHGISLRELGRYEEAIKDFDRAIKLASEQDPQLVELYNERRQTYMRMGDYEKAISDAQRCVTLAGEQEIYQFHLFCALFAAGHYDLAEAKYAEVFHSDKTYFHYFWRRCAGFVFETLGDGRELYLPDNSCNNAAFLPIDEAVKDYSCLAAKAKRVISDGFHANWSPDGSQLVYSMGPRGKSGIAAYDLHSQETELLAIPGKDPVYSPDGRYIAYVRDRQIVPVTDLTAEREPDDYEVPGQVEIWIMKADGTEPRRLTWGKWPHWSKDSKRVFYKDLLQGELKSIDIDGGATEPTPVFSCQNLEPRVSPDNKYIAYVEKNTLKILDFSSQELIASWTGPSGMWRGSWAPNNRLFSVVKQIQAYRVGTGLWIYDLNKKKTEKVLGPPSLIIGWVCWSPDEHQLAFALGRFVDEIWVIETEKLGPAQTAEENCQEMADLFRRMAKASPQNPEMYLFHAACYLESAERMKRSAIHTEHADLALGALTNLGPRVNSQSNDCMPSISSDGLELYFASDRPGGSGGYDLWVAKRESINDNWFTPVNLGMVVNSGNYDIWPSISAGGLTLYFCSSRPGGYGGEDIWVTTRASRDDNWSAPVNLSPAINSSSRDRAPVISADGLELFFASTRYGNYDLWVARRGTKDSDWSAPVNLGPGINSLHIESGPALSADGLWLFFHSNWPGGSGSNSDIYVMRRETKKDDWYQPGNLGPGINTAYAEVCPTVSADGRSLFFSDSRWSVPRPGGFGGADLWQVPIGSMPTTSELGRDVDLDEKSVKTDDKKEAVPVKNK